MKPVTVGTCGTLVAAILTASGIFAAKPAPPSQARDSNKTGPPRPASGAELIVLSEHVDYWNRLGWTDPFSSALLTERQQDYVTQLNLGSAYTPQLVVDDRDAVRAES